MLYTRVPVPPFVLVILGASALIACEPSKGGTSDTTDSTTDETTGTTGSTAVTTDDPETTETEATETTGTSDSQTDTEATTDTESTDTTGDPNTCPQTENFTCHEFEIDCNQIDCGSLDSPFDENGCLRETCNSGGGCSEGDECYTPIDWGGCASSGLFCSDSNLQMACICGGDADCNGSYCVPHELYPVTEFMGGPGRVDNSCAPDDGPAHEFIFGLAEQTCDALVEGESLRIILHSENFGFGFEPLPPGTYSLEGGNGFAFYDDGINDPKASDMGFVHIDSWDTVVSGSYKVWAGDNVFEGEFSAIEYCDNNPLCG